MSTTAILMRHGEADIISDDLNEKSRQQVMSVANQLIAIEIQPDILLHSPLSRAVATTRILEDQYRAAGKSITRTQMEPRLHEGKALIEPVLAGLSKERTALVISHSYDVLIATMGLCDDGFDTRINYAEAIIIKSESNDWRDLTSSNPKARFKIISHLKPA